MTFLLAHVDSLRRKIVVCPLFPPRETEPQSVAELAKVTGRQRSDLSRTLKTMSRYGLVDLRREKKNVRPIAKVSDFQIQASA
jgi:predicted transcriptional regulator